MSVKVKLRDGPFAGAEVEVATLSTPLLAESDEKPGYAARYRPTRERGVYRFHGWDRIVGRLPAPGA